MITIEFTTILFTLLNIGILIGTITIFTYLIIKLFKKLLKKADK